MEIICKRCCQSNGCRHTRKKTPQLPVQFLPQDPAGHLPLHEAVCRRWKMASASLHRYTSAYNTQPKESAPPPGSAEQRVFDDILLFMYLKSADRIDDNNRKHQSCRTVQSIISFNHSLKERNFCICSPRGTDAAILNPAMR